MAITTLAGIWLEFSSCRRNGLPNPCRCRLEGQLNYPDPPLNPRQGPCEGAGREKQCLRTKVDTAMTQGSRSHNIFAALHLPSYGLGDLHDVRTRSCRVKEPADQFALAHPRNFAVAAAGRQHLLASDVLAPRLFAGPWTAATGDQGRLFSRLTEHFNVGACCRLSMASSMRRRSRRGQLEFLAALGGGRQNGLFFPGDLGPEGLPAAVLLESARRRGQWPLRHPQDQLTSHQLRLPADRLLGPELANVDGNVENRRGTVSVFNGPQPVIETPADAGEALGNGRPLVAGRVSDGVQPHEIAVFVRSADELPPG